MAQFNLDPLSLNPSGITKSAQNGINDSLDEVDTGHLLQSVTDLGPIKGPIPQACKDGEIQTALAELALPHINPHPPAVRSAIDLSIRGDHAPFLSISRTYLNDSELGRDLREQEPAEGIVNTREGVAVADRQRQVRGTDDGRRLVQDVVAAES
jgi:hypothetical protein